MVQEESKKNPDKINEFEFGYIQYHSCSGEILNIGVILKSENKIAFKMIDSFRDIADSYSFKNIDGLDFPLDMFRKRFEEKPFFGNFNIAVAIKVFIPDIPFMQSEKNFDDTLIELWEDDVRIAIKEHKIVNTITD